VFTYTEGSKKNDIGGLIDKISFGKTIELWAEIPFLDQNCSFLDGKRCSVYEGRPSQCRTWPFWPENMNARTWNREIVPFCPGVGKGRLYTAEEIKAAMDQDPLL
jgi:Fe-S-cluster containining protein